MMDWRGAGGSLSLRDAVDRFRLEEGSPANVYDWWRRGAQRFGHVTFGQRRQLIAGGSTDVPAYKAGNKWIVDAVAFEAALAEHRAYRAELQFIADAYEQHRLLVGPGKRVDVSWGHYRVAEGFHVRCHSASRPSHDHVESWVCNNCWRLASLEHGKPECHTCSDWGTCGRDCTLSAVVCADCAARLNL